MSIDSKAREAYPLMWSTDPAAIADWATACLGLVESWRAPGEDGAIEHVELHWRRTMISINVAAGRTTGPSGVGLRVEDRAAVDAVHARAVAAGATIVQGPGESRVAYSFTATDPDGNEWWVHAESGFLDTLRASAPVAADAN